MRCGPVSSVISSIDCSFGSVNKRFGKAERLLVDLSGSKYSNHTFFYHHAYLLG